MSRLERIEVIWLNFCFALMVDQAKNALVQPLIWWFVIRRCGRVHPGIQDYNEEYILQWELEESLMDALRRQVHEFLEWRPIMFGIIGLVGFYSLFVMTAIATEEYWIDNPVISDMFKYGDFAFLCIFIFEIVLKTFSYGTKFVCDAWNFFDS